MIQLTRAAAPSIFGARDDRQSLCFLMQTFSQLVKEHRETGHYGASLLDYMTLAVRCGGRELATLIGLNLGGGPEVDMAIEIAVRRVD